MAQQFTDRKLVVIGGSSGMSRQTHGRVSVPTRDGKPYEEIAMHPTIGYHLAQARIAGLRHHTQRVVLARPGRRGRGLGRALPGSSQSGWAGPSAPAA